METSDILFFALFICYVISIISSYFSEKRLERIIKSKDIEIQQLKDKIGG